MYGFMINASFSKIIIITLLKRVTIYKIFVYLSSPANQSVQLLVKCKLEIERIATKSMPTFMMLNRPPARKAKRIH